MFDTNSRYYPTPTYTVTDSRGRTVRVVAVPDAPNQTLLGYHLLQRGQRTDHLANRYLNDPTQSWRISEINGVMLPETLTEQSQIAIPEKDF